MYVCSTSITGSAQGLHCAKCGPCGIENVTTESCGKGFAACAPKGTVMFTNCTAMEYQTGAFFVQEQGELVRMHKCQVGPPAVPDSFGVGVREQARLLISDSSVQCAEFGVGVTDHGSSLRMVRCKVVAAIGVYAEEEARVQLSHCGNSRCEQAGVKIGPTAVELSHCVSGNDRVGVWCCNSTVDVDHLHASHLYCGVCLEGDGRM